ncbi:hypothetical protein AN958_08461 [Leucoagaricus sp. SymC.cos]|nr:hypothetical protein AN958_08461 [Leucoagaricus sp. SymC.cos]
MFTPIVLPSFSPSALTETKAIITSLSVIRHTIAVSLVRDVPLHFFSAEWMEQVRQSGRITLDETDIVSRITTGYLDHIRHWISSLPNHTTPERPPDTITPVGSRYQECSPDVPFVFTAPMCDPQFEIRPATVSLYRGSLSAQIHSAGLPTVGNISPSAANFIFANSLGDARSFPSDNSGTRPNDIARNIFLTDPRAMSSQSNVDTPPIHIINQKMDSVLLSSSKALLGGYNEERGNTSFRDFDMIITEAVDEVEVLALGGSKPFLLSLAALVGTLFLLTVGIALVVRHGNQLRPFDTRHIIETLGVLPRE